MSSGSCSFSRHAALVHRRRDDQVAPLRDRCDVVLRYHRSPRELRCGARPPRGDVYLAPLELRGGEPDHPPRPVKRTAFRPPLELLERKPQRKGADRPALGGGRAWW